MRGAALVLALAACADAPPRPHVSYPTLEPDGRIGATPIDPYGPESSLHGLVGEVFPSDVELGDPGSVTKLVVRVQTAGYQLPSTPHHHVIVDRDRIQHLTIEPGPGAVISPAERAEALRATSTFDTRDPAIRRTARAATSGTRTDRQRVDALVSWVYTHVTYERADENVASVVLARARGDCTEMSLLFVALARAVGLPARRVVGLAGTVQDGASAFGLHAWAEVALDGHWVQVDPTWNETVADATHVMVAQGEEHWGAAFDQLRVAVDDVHRDPHLRGRADARLLTRELPSYMRLGR